MLCLPWHIVVDSYPAISFKEWLENAVKNHPTFLTTKGNPVWSTIPDDYQSPVNEKLTKVDDSKRYYLKHWHLSCAEDDLVDFLIWRTVDRNACCELDLEGKIIGIDVQKKETNKGTVDLYSSCESEGSYKALRNSKNRDESSTSGIVGAYIPPRRVADPLGYWLY
jgi:hypothetical protein